MDAQSRTARIGCKVEFAKRSVNLGQITVEDRGAGPKGNGATNQLDGTRLVADLMREHAKKVQSVRVGGTAGENCLVLCLCLVEQPLLMISECDA